MSRENPVTPPSLDKGDTIAIMSPATTVGADYVEGAVRTLEALGFKVSVMPHALGPADGSYASSADSRLSDFMDAYSRKDVKAILCARGGYGCIHLIDKIPWGLLRKNPKWIIGFSDVSALHAMMRRAGVRSVHSSMAKHLAVYPPDDLPNSSLLKILTGCGELSYSGPADPRNIPGHATGELRGGNLAVLDGLVGTPFDTLIPAEDEDVILFVEDIGEAIYRTERMVRRLALAGALSRYKGIVVGQFTDSRSDMNFATTADMLRRRLPEWGVGDVPVAFNFPIGHFDGNLPVVHSSAAALDVTGEGSRLTMRW